jgi:hypothetical protein
MEHHLTVHQEFTLRQFAVDGIFKFDFQRILSDAPDACLIETGGMEL